MPLRRRRRKSYEEVESRYSNGRTEQWQRAIRELMKEQDPAVRGFTVWLLTRDGQRMIDDDEFWTFHKAVQERVEKDLAQERVDFRDKGSG